MNKYIQESKYVIIFFTIKLKKLHNFCHRVSYKVRQSHIKSHMETDIEFDFSQVLL